MKIDESALNDATWKFIEEWTKYNDDDISGSFFNDMKGIIRETIKVYLKQERQNENI